MTLQTITHKRGDTFSWGGLATLPAGTWTATSTVRRADGAIVEPLTVTLEELGAPDEDGNTHTILIEGTSTAAADWPIGKLRCDVRFADSSSPPVVEHSPTFLINVTQEET